MGEDCGILCNGLQIFMDSGVCVCYSGCDYGEFCQNICNGMQFENKKNELWSEY